MEWKREEIYKMKRNTSDTNKINNMVYSLFSGNTNLKIINKKYVLWTKLKKSSQAKS